MFSYPLSSPPSSLKLLKQGFFMKIIACALLGFFLTINSLCFAVEKTHKVKASIQLQYENSAHEKENIQTDVMFDKDIWTLITLSDRKTNNPFSPQVFTLLGKVETLEPSQSAIKFLLLDLDSHQHFVYENKIIVRNNQLGEINLQDKEHQLSLKVKITQI